MPLPTSPANSWTQRLDLPSRLFGTEGTDFELYEEDGEFVLTVDMPGFEREEIDVRWTDGRLNVAAEHVSEERGRKKTYHRSFRVPKEIDHEEIAAHYRNGVLEVTLPMVEDATPTGYEIEVES
ncbi:Hsp20/alpha crystallin family protein [Halomontanus rarus]|uniref:Hsp20/alpha crystallin family protein n=1 Tax=Halomontanus rarus TaxID=3034020 RepID=UPI001A9898FE|nr:Hsp20/alpha crystallin family protein [Halovivax sp. TS33]